MKRNTLSMFNFTAKSSLFFLALLLAVGFTTSIAQNVQYDVETSVQQATELHIQAWEKVEKTTIFCIQLGSFSGENSGARAQQLVNEINNRLQQQQLPAHAYITFDAPNHKVRVGNFNTRQEAYATFHTLQVEFPGAFITRDKRKVKDIISQPNEK